LNRAKDKRDRAKECHAAKATEDFHAIFESEFVSDGCFGALYDHYNAREEYDNTQKCSVAQASYNFRAWEQLFLGQFCFGAPLDKRCKFPVHRFAGEAQYQTKVTFGIYENWRGCPSLNCQSFDGRQDALLTERL
jgi:hypothetical protein